MVRVKHFELRIIGVLAAQQAGLFERLRKLLPLLQGANVIEVRADVVWVEQHSRFEQKFGFVISVETRADLREQSHPLDMMTLRLEEMAAKLLGLVQPSFLDETGDRSKVRRQRRQIVDLALGEIGW